jgi:RNA polymerase sigma-70 factor (ECF subfamily)
LTDEELLISAQSGNTQSLGVLVARWERPLYRFVYRMSPSPDDASDICQETFLRVMKKAHRFRKGSRFSTWMYQIALNLCRDQARRKRRWSRILDRNREFDERNEGVTGNGTDGNGPWAEVEQRERRLIVKQALGQIPPEQREVLILKEFEGLKFKEIAAILDCPESTVKSRMYYGLSGLRTALLRRGFTGP